MAGEPRMSSFMPTIKCSTCAADVEISRMGEHVCGEAPVLSVPEPMPSPDEFNERNIPYGKPLPAADKYSRVPPRVDTSAANRGFMRPGQLTPNSTSSGSRSVSPRTPGGRFARTDDYFSPSIASDYGQSPPPPTGRPGGYGGLGVPPSYVDDVDQYSESPKKSSFIDRMNGIAPGPFENRGKPTLERNAVFPSLNNSNDDRYGLGAMDRPGTSMSQNSNGSSSMAPPRAPRNNGYGGFGPPPGREPERTPEDFEPQPFGRAGTFPKQDLPRDAPSRTPSAPGARPDHRRKYSMGPDTSRKPPPRTSLTKINGVPSINLSSEFGIGNPYYTPTASVSGMSMYSASSGRPSNLSSISNMTSPSSVDSFQQQPQPPSLSNPGAKLFDSLMSDLQSSMEELQPREVTSSYPDSRANPAMDNPTTDNSYVNPRDDRYGRWDGDGYGGQDEYKTNRSDSRNDYARAPSRGNDFGRGASPLPSPMSFDPAIQGGLAGGRRSRASPLPSPSLEPPAPRQADPWSRSPDRERGNSENRGRDRDMHGEDQTRNRYATESRERYDDGYRFKPASSQPPPSDRMRAPSRARRPEVNRGNCRACGEAIRGKSISSADGRLSGKYHKACFVCTTCKEPFAGTTFYVHSDKPYCERHYHQVNGSLCGKCKRGIEGEYLADEEGTKYHPDCFRCADCGEQLRDGYFEVDGVAYCERDAWRRVQPPKPQQQYAAPQANPQPRHERQRSAGFGGLNAGLGGLSAGPKVGRNGIGLPQQPGAGRNMRMGGNMMMKPPGMPMLNKRMTRLGMM